MKSTEQINPETQKSPTEREKRIRKLTIGAIGLVLGLATITGATGCVARSMGEVDKHITSVTIETGARLRSDPNVADVNNGDSPNLLATNDTTFTVEANNDIKSTNDSDWYGIPAESLKRVDPDLDVSGDKDGVIWVNQQKAPVTRDTDSVSK
jgi:hypothetical protein